LSLKKNHGVALLLVALASPATICFAQEKPDAPVPKVSIDPNAQGAQAPAQTASPAPQNPPAPAPQTPPDDNPKRILDIIPNFQTTNQTPEYAPMTPREKYVLAYHQTVDFSAHIGNAFQAMLQQASNGQPHYGQGWGAYGQRFGAAEADQVTSAFFIFGFLPHVLKQDPRYFRKAKGSPWSRISYAASRTVIARADTGNATFNTPQVLGQLLQQGISTTYYPQQDRSASGVFQNWGVNLAYNSAYNVLKEYYPDFLRWVFHRHPKQKTPAAIPSNDPPTNLAAPPKNI
jgi:hypothetical protein